MKLSLAMIVKDGLQDLKRLKPLVEPHIDEWVVVFPPGDKAINWAKKNGIKAVVKDFTQTVEPEIREKMADLSVDIPEDYKLFNFADARNESFSKATGDWILWLDADDHPKGLKTLRKTLESTKADIIDVVYDYSKDSEGDSVSDHVRERAVRNDERFVWKGGALGLIHETITYKEPFIPKRDTLTKEEVFIEHHSDHQEESSNRNFIALLYEYLKTEGRDPRTIYYLGVEFFNHKMFYEAITVLKKYVKVGGWEEERYRAWLNIAESYHQIGDKASSKNAYLAAQKELPQYPDSYLGLGESYYSDEDYGRAIEYIMTGLSKGVPETKSAINLIKYTFRPYVFIALSHLKTGRAQEGYKWFEKAKKVKPNHPWVEQYQELFDDSKELDDYVRSFIKLGRIANKLYPETLPKLAEVIPDEIMDQEILLNFRRQFGATKKWGDNSIVYFCSQSFEEWGPDSLETGCGGSEEAVIHLTKRWAEAGYDVTVFNNCPVEKTVDGVTWKRFERFNPNDEFNILIGWRNNPFLEPKNAKKKLIDVHDVPSLRFFPEHTLEDVTMMVKSKYHRSLFPHLEDDNFKIINNGIDPKQFDKSKTVKNNVVWTSSYDRGLEHLLEMWPEVKKKVPDATLDVYYGFNLFDQSPYGKSAKGKEWKETMLELLDQDGVTEHGRVNTDEIAEAYNKADIWAYPTDFPEIDCITATKAMAAGCVPITTDFAVMKERNQGVMLRGDIRDDLVFTKFKLILIELMLDEDSKQRIRDNIDVSDFSWDSVAFRWAEEFDAR